MKIESTHITLEVIALLKRGDVLAFDQVYRRFCHRLFLFAFKILKDESDAEDIVQEVFIKLWELRNELDDHKHLNSLLFMITYNSSINLLRKKISSTKYLEHLKLNSVNQNSDDPGVEAEINELKIQIEKLIGSLPDRQKQVFLAHRESGLTYSEIANEMGISENTVENHMSKALKFLRLHLKSFLPIVKVIFTILK